jgi:autotransporter-associated beta strand protein
MTGNNALPGAMTVSAGELSMSGNNTFSSGARTVNGGILRLGGANSGTGVTTLNAGELILSGANTFSGAVTVNGGTLSITGSGTPGSGAVALNAGTLKIADTGTLGSGAILLVGGTTVDLSDRTGVLSLGASQAVTIRCGATTVSLVTDAGTGLTLGSSAPLRFDNYADAATPLTVSGGGSLTLQSGNAVTVTAAGAPLAADDHVLIADGAAGSLPGSLALQGAGRAAGTTAAWVMGDGDLVLRIADYTPTHAPAAIATQAPGGEWYDAATWLGGVIPGPGDRVTVSNNVALACGTYEMERATVNAGATLTFATWNAVLNATHVTNNGTMTHPVQNAAEPDPGSGEWIPDNRVWIVCSNLTVGAAGVIHGDYMGYAAVMAATGRGPGKSYVSGYRTGGAGHGGRGGWGGTEFATPGVSYGNPADPVSPGSSSAGRTQSTGLKAGKNGGGAVRIDATGDIALAGRISADGAGNESYIGGGSGGGIRIQCRTIQGNGTLRAVGGDSNGGGGEGGGGRIAVYYDTTAQAQVAVPTLTLSVSAGKRLHLTESQFGTLYLSDTRLLTPSVSNIRGWLHIPGFTSWSPASLTLTNSYLGFAPPNFQLSVAGAVGGSGDRMLALGTNAVVTVGGDLDASLTFVSGGRCAVGGHVRIPVTTWMNYHSLTAEADVTAEGSLTLQSIWRFTSAPTNGVISYGSLLAAGADMCIVTNAQLYLYSNPTNGGSALLQMENLSLTNGGIINADSGGFGGRPNGTGYGPGGGLKDGSTGGGGGYGGRGGKPTGGNANGLAYAPCGPGSAGGGRSGGGLSAPGNSGGGLVRIEARDRVLIDGTITANGSGAINYAGSGAGGGIFIRAASFAGAGTGVLRANGGNRNSNGGAGGGGRIAVWTGDIGEAAAAKILAGQQGTLGARFSASTSLATYAGSATADKGTGTEDGAVSGTVFFVTVHPPGGTVLLLR